MTAGDVILRLLLAIVFVVGASLLMRHLMGTNKPHKNAKSRLSLTTLLPARQVAELAKGLADESESSWSLGQGVQHKIRFEGSSPGRVLFSVRDKSETREYLTFHLDIESTDSGTSTALSALDSFKTTQRTYWWIPAEQLQMPGYGAYRIFMTRLSEAIRGQDPNAKITITETELN